MGKPDNQIEFHLYIETIPDYILECDSMVKKIAKKAKKTKKKRKSAAFAKLEKFKKLTKFGKIKLLTEEIRKEVKNKNYVSIVKRNVIPVYVKILNRTRIEGGSPLTLFRMKIRQGTTRVKDYTPLERKYGVFDLYTKQLARYLMGYFERARDNISKNAMPCITAEDLSVVFLGFTFNPYLEVKNSEIQIKDGDV